MFKAEEPKMLHIQGEKINKNETIKWKTNRMKICLKHPGTSSFFYKENFQILELQVTVHFTLDVNYVTPIFFRLCQMFSADSLNCGPDRVS